MLTKDVTQQIAHDTIVLTKSQIQSYKEQLQQCLINITLNEKNSNSNLTSIKNLSRNVNLSQVTSERELGKVLMAQRTRAKQINELNEYDKLFLQLEAEYKKAYLLINEIRAIFFGEITYSFGFQLDGEIYQVNVSEKDLFPLIHLQMVSRTKEFSQLFGLRIQAGANLREWKEKMETQRGLIFAPIENTDKILWEKLKELQPKARINDGYRYETYRRLLSEEKTDINAFKNKSSLHKFLIGEMRKTKKNTLSWLHGGDVGREQDKYMDASITSSTTLINALQFLINEVFSENAINNIDTMKTNIVKLFGEGSNFQKKVLSKAEEEAFNAIKESLQLEIIN